jgi:hypothetical protein
MRRAFLFLPLAFGLVNAKPFAAPTTRKALLEVHAVGTWDLLTVERNSMWICLSYTVLQIALLRNLDAVQTIGYGSVPLWALSVWNAFVAKDAKHFKDSARYTWAGLMTIMIGAILL